MRTKPYLIGWLLLLLLLGLMMSACATSPAPIAEPTATPTPAEAVAESTATPMSAPEEEPTISATPAATTPLAVTPLAACPVAPDEAFTTLVEQAGDASACPTGEAFERAGAYETFEHGLMLWVAGPESDRDGMIYVLFEDGTWQLYPDTWTEAEPGRAELEAPPGLLEPERGFGKVWREQLGGASSSLGWATQREEGVEMTLQPLNGSGMMLAYEETVYYLPEGGTWLVQ